MRRAAILYYFRTNTGQPSSYFKCVNLEKDYYRVLEVESGACENTIKRSYLKLVRKLHPDLNPLGHDKFTEVQEAYNILSDKKLKGYYDQNNSFYQQQADQRTHEDSKSYEDPRNQQFYSQMKGKYYQDFNDRTDYRQQQEEPQESQEQAKQRKRFEDEIKLTRRILFTKNPIWEQANAYMNYEERQRRVEEKQKEFEALFPNSAKLANSFKKWMI